MNYYRLFLTISSNGLTNENEVFVLKNIIENIDHINLLKLSDLAEMSYTSTTSIVRFLKRFRFTSYGDFKEKITLDYKNYQVSYPDAINTLDHEIENAITSLDDMVKQINYPRIIQLATRLANAKSVTIVGNFHAQEIMRVTCFTLIAYQIPCYMFKSFQNLQEHLSLLDEDDLILYVHNDAFIQPTFAINPKPQRILLEVNELNPKGFKEEDIYHVIEKGDNLYQSLLFIGKTLNTYIVGVKEGMIHEIPINS